MPNIKLEYRYHDYANYKNNGEAIFSNPENLSLEAIDSALRERLLDDLWFYASRWALPDLHFEKYDDEIDHPFHEFIAVELTNEAPTEKDSIADFVKKLI